MASEPTTPSSRLSADRMSLLTKVARMYHEQKIRQPDIAQRLHISQSRVSRLLQEAVTLGVVRTIVVPPPGVFSDLEDDVRLKYGLTDVVVAESSGPEESLLLAALGSAGAAYLETTLNHDDRVGISSWSDTLLSVVDSMSPRTVQTAEVVVQMLGGVGNPTAQARATHLADRLARVTGATAKYFPAPGIVANESVRDALLADPYIGEVAKSWDQLTVALVGIGSLDASPLLAFSGNSVGGQDLETLTTVGAVGDVCLQFFDVDGSPVDGDVENRVLGISRSQLMRIPRKIGVAGGQRKHTAIRAAVVGRWIDVLITDVETASRLAANG